MGGFGSGNRGNRCGTKDTVKDARELAIADVRRHITTPGSETVTFGKSFVKSSPTKVMSVSHISLTLALAWTACNYGSQRPWFRCPKCARRVAKLYQPDGTTRYSTWQCRQ